MEQEPSSNQLVQHQYNGLTNLWEERLSILEEQAHLPCQQEQASCMFRQVKFREVLEKTKYEYGDGSYFENFIQRL
jgi:hypothetical protein